jgi:hypothetical protein
MSIAGGGFNDGYPRSGLRPAPILRRSLGLFPVGPRGCLCSVELLVGNPPYRGPDCTVADHPKILFALGVRFLALALQAKAALAKAYLGGRLYRTARWHRRPTSE